MPQTHATFETVSASAGSLVSTFDVGNPAETSVTRTRPSPVFEELYQAHCSPLRRTALNWVGNVHDAEDAVQEAFLRAYRSAASFAGQSALSTWLYRILINICHDLRRQRIRRPEPQEFGTAGESIKGQAVGGD